MTLYEKIIAAYGKLRGKIDGVYKYLADNYYTAKTTEEKINGSAAFYITREDGTAFPSVENLEDGPWYSEGVERAPTRNDYAVVSADNASARYIYTTDGWKKQYDVEANDYSRLDNKPQINGQELSGNQTGASLGLADKDTVDKIEDAMLPAVWNWTNSTGQRWQWQGLVNNRLTWVYSSAQVGVDSAISYDKDRESPWMLVNYSIGSGGIWTSPETDLYAEEITFTKTTGGHLIVVSREVVEYLGIGELKSEVEKKRDYDDLSYNGGDSDSEEDSLALMSSVSAVAERVDGIMEAEWKDNPRFGVDEADTVAVYADGSRIVTRVASFSATYDGENDKYVSDQIPTDNLVGLYCGTSCTTVGEYSFADCETLKTVVGTSITEIRDYAFYACTNLDSVVLPSVESVGGNSFYRCTSLREIRLPMSLTAAFDAFGNCENLEYSELGVATVADDRESFPFLGCSALKTVVLANIENIGQDWNFDYWTPGLSVVDFGNTLTQVPALPYDDMFPAGCKFIVPDALYGEWVATGEWKSMYEKGFRFIRHSDWEYARKYEISEKIDALTGDDIPLHAGDESSEGSGSEDRQTISEAISANAKGLKDLQADLEALREELTYKAIAISSFSVSPSQVEIGATQTTATLTWGLNKEAKSATLDGAAVTLTSTSGTISLTGLSLTANKTWTLTATDAGSPGISPHTATATATINFRWKRYWGVAADSDVTDDFLNQTLGNSEMASSRAKTFTVTAGADQYIWYAVPESWGECSFKVGGFDGGFHLETTFSHTNASGGQTNYRVYRSDNAALGSTTVTVS